MKQIEIRSYPFNQEVYNALPQENALVLKQLEVYFLDNRINWAPDTIKSLTAFALGRDLEKAKSWVEKITDALATYSTVNIEIND